MTSSVPELSPSFQRSPLTPLPIAPNGIIPPADQLPPPGLERLVVKPRMLRHKPSLRSFHPHVDSSESIPSAHSSIYEASVQASPLDDTIPARSAILDFTPLSAATKTTASVNDTPSSSAPPIPNETDSLSVEQNLTMEQIFAATLIHHPHILAPISERPSASTLRTSLSTLRTRSISLPPLPPGSSSISSTPSPPPPPSPHLPYLPPPPRPPTPPGLPTFNSPAAVSYRLPAPPMRFRDRLRPTTPRELEWRAQTVNLPRGVVMRGDGGVLVRGGFRQGAGMELDMGRHPWSQGAAGTNGGSGGNVNTLRRAGRAQSNLILARQEAERARTQRATEGNEVEGTARRGVAGSSTSRWDRVWEKTSWICCGDEGSEAGEEELRVMVVDGEDGGGGDRRRIEHTRPVAGLGGGGPGMVRR